MDIFEEKSHGQLKYEYRMGLDVHAGKQVAVRFIMNPSKITLAGNEGIFKNTYLNNNPDDDYMVYKVCEKIKELKNNGQYDAADDLKKRLDAKMDRLTKDSIDDALKAVRKNIRKTGHIDHVTSDLMVDKIFFKNGKSVNSIELVPMLSNNVEHFINYIGRDYDLTKFIERDSLNESKLFDQEYIQRKFAAWCIENNIHGEKYEVGKMGGGDKYKTTKLLWNTFADFTKFVKSPSVRGYLAPYKINSNDKEYNGYNKPKRAWKESSEVIESNFDSISSYIMEHTGINLFDPVNEFTETTGLTGPNDSELSSEIFKVVGRSPEEIQKWMHENISYDHTIQGWTLKTPAEVFKSRTGNCHDQSLFESFLFHSLGIINGQLFFVEFSNDNPIAGNTHTLTWYRIDTPNESYKYSYYWIENAWEDQAGIHGPYNDINGLKHAVFEIYKNDHDINQGKYDGIVFSTLSNYRCGMSLGEYVKSWRLEDDHPFSKNIPNVRAEINPSKNPNDPESQEAVDITFFNDDEDKIGNASVSSINTDHAFLYNVEVVPQFRGKGYAHSIMRYCLEHWQISEVTVEPTNSIAINLYKKYGFKKYMDWEENGRKLIDMRRDISEPIPESSELKLDEPKYYRVTYNSIGIYEAIRKHTSVEKWKELLKSDNFTWLPKPKEYPSSCRSYFTRKGMDMFNDLVSPIVSEIIGDNMKIEEFSPDEIGNIVYEDSYQVITSDDMNTVINESIKWIENFANSDKFQEKAMMEASHGKLKYDFRVAIDINTCHVIKIIYSLDNINVTRTTIGGGNKEADDVNEKYINSDYKSEEDFVKAKIKKYGNTNHQSKGQKILAIVDTKTGKRLKEIDCIGIFEQNGLSKSALNNPKILKEEIKKYGIKVFHVKIGEIENELTYKSTFFPRKSSPAYPKTDEYFSDMIGVRQNRAGRSSVLNKSNEDLFKVTSERNQKERRLRESSELQNIDSFTFRNEYITEWINPADRLFSDMQGLSTPLQLFKFMNKIKYGWISSDDGQVHGTGGAEDEDYFFKYYRLQSPDELASSLVGVCWDQTEFEREWFKEHGYGHKIYYLELDDREGCPSHTFASYISKETGRLYWFEHSWDKYAGMHYYKSESELLKDVISRHREEWDDKLSPVILSELKDTPRYGMTCEEFMNFSHSQPRINVDDLMGVNRNDIITDGIGENVVLPTHTCPECNHTSSNVEVRFDSPVDYDRISQLHPDWDLSKGRIGYIICPKCNTRNDIVVNENTISPRFLKEIADGISSEPLDEYDPPLPYEQLPEHLKNDPVHVWRAKHGIELIHKEPTLEELNRIWRNWQLMSDEQKIISNNESMKLFGMDNEEHYYALIKEYDALAESHLPYGDIFDEKSHGSLKYCYRIGFDADTGKEVAIQFILDSSKVTKAGDDPNISFAQQTTGNTEKSVDELNADALSTLKKNIKKYGYIDFSTDELEVDKIFYKHGSSVNSIRLIPLFSRAVIDVMNSTDRFFRQIKKDDLTSNELFETREFQDALVSRIKSSGVVPELYTVGAVSGKGKYKTTKLLWDREALLSYKFTPVLRGFNRYGRGVNVSDMKDYIDKDLNNKFKESCEGDINIMNSMVSMNTFWGESSLTVNIPFNEPLNRFGYPIESDIEDIYIESIVNCIDENGEYVASQLLEKRGKVTGCCSSCGTNLSSERITDIPKKDYEKVASQFPNWDGRYGKLGMIKCPNCGELNYLITENFNENWLIIEDDLKINFEQWRPGNPLWITGASGDGKSTLVEKIASNKGAEIVTSDIVLCRIGWTKEEFDELLKGESSSASAYKMNVKDSPAVDYVLSHPDLPYGAKDPKTKCVNDNITGPEMVKFYQWFMKESANNPKYKERLFIIEGCDICLMDPEIMAKKPLIILGGSRIRSLLRRAKRDAAEKDRPILKSIFKYIKKYNTSNRRLDDNKDSFRKGVEKALGESDTGWLESYLAEEGESMPKQTDAAESNKNGVNRKKLYIAFIEWCKEYNSKNTFGSLFDKDVFNVTYPFVPEEMRYFYRLANPLLCVLAGKLTFFQVSELKKLNAGNSKLNEMMIFAATPNDMRVFNRKDKKIYKGIDENGQLKLAEVLGNTFDTYIQSMIKKGDILNSPTDEVTEN